MITKDSISLNVLLEIKTVERIKAWQEKKSLDGEDWN
jgi:hypothetical protein